MNVSFAKVTLRICHYIMLIPQVGPLMPWEVTRNGQCKNAVHITIDLGRQEEKWRERERGQEVRTGGEGRTLDR